MLKKQKSGQVALIVLLIMIVILTIGLSLASRSITDVRISQDEKEALRAFSAAEAGIEEVLRDISYYAGKTEPVDVGDLQAIVAVEETGEGTTQKVEKGETMNILLDDLGAGDDLYVEWMVDPDEVPTPASIEIVVYATDSTFSRYAYNANGIAPPNTNDFDNGGAGGAGFHSRATVSLGANDSLARIRPFYNETTIKVTSNGNLGVQQYNITSSVEAESEKISKIEVTRTIPVLPPIFDYALFSGSNLSN